MFNPARALHENPALFACYVLFVYFRGRNAVRIEREMRSLGYTTFHRRNLYPRGRQPGWIGRFGWQQLSVPPAVAGGSTQQIDVLLERKTGPQIDTDKHRSKASHRNSISVHQCSSVDKNSPRLGASAVENPDFHTWLKRVSPKMNWDWKHQQVIIGQLNKVTTGDCKRLMIFLPPRHGKSELVSVRYTAWRMQRDPSMNVILGSYNQRLADRMSRKIRTVICDSEALKAEPPASAGGTAPDARTPRVPSARSDTNTTPPAHAGGSALDSGSPFPFSRPRPKNAVSEWETAAGGSFRAVGSGSGVTGFGANLIVIDDPVKNRAQAESETFRNRVWDWYKDDLYTRLEPDGSIVLIQTRWHEDDLAGRLLRENLDDWTIINLPALSEAGSAADTELKQDAQYADHAEPPASAVGHISTTDRFGINQELRSSEHLMSCHPDSDADIQPPADACGSAFKWRTAPNIALCPERFPIEELERLRTQLGTYSFSALYQQRPTPAGGQIFKREWFKNIIDFEPPGLKWKRGYDLAVSTRTESDYTASFRCAFDKQGNLYISGGFRRRIEFPEQRRYILDRMLNEPDTEHGVELALHGQALLQELRRDPAIRGKSLSGVSVSTDKITRALTWSPLAEAGKVILVRSSVLPASASRHMSVPPAVAGGSTRSNKTSGTPVNSTTETDCIDTEISPRPRTKVSQNISVHPCSSVDEFSPRLGLSAGKYVDWISDLLDELAAFPNGTHDDQIDAISIAVQMLAKRKYRAGGFLIT